MAGVTSPKHFVRLVKEHREDLRVWHSFLDPFNGRALWMSGRSVNLIWSCTRTASSTGFAAFFQGRWSAGPWPQSWKEAGFTQNLVLLELFLVVLAIELWGESFRDLKVCFHGDNLGVVKVINKVSASSLLVVRLIKHLVLRCLQLNIFIYAVHLPGVENVIAEARSRFQWDKFWELVPAA